VDAQKRGRVGAQLNDQGKGGEIGLVRGETRTYHGTAELPASDTGRERIFRNGDLLIDDAVGKVVLSTIIQRKNEDCQLKLHPGKRR
jgi:hypothetical protein